MEVSILTEEKLKLNGIFVETGLHIGASDDAMKIGGIDLPVVKRQVWVYYNSNKEEDPKNGEIALSFEGNSEHYRKLSEPYIPGSSIKGKVRSLLEHFFGLIREQVVLSATNSEITPGLPIDSRVVNEIDDRKKRLLGKMIVAAFGESGSLKKESPKYPAVTRFVFRDCYITKDIRKKALKGDIELSEAKTENSIDRIKGTVNTNLGGLRTAERVPSGVRFDFKVSIRTFTDKEKELFENLMKLGLALLQLDGLGGSTSRGYGQISFITSDKKKWEVTQETINYLKEKIFEQVEEWEQAIEQYKKSSKGESNSNSEAEGNK